MHTVHISQSDEFTQQFFQIENIIAVGPHILFSTKQEGVLTDQVDRRVDFYLPMPIISLVAYTSLFQVLSAEENCTIASIV